MRVTSGQSGGPLQVGDLFRALKTYASMALSLSITGMRRSISVNLLAVLQRRYS
jgi:hypothetical protein